MQTNPRLKRGLRCSSSCVTRDHLTWGECTRAKGLQLKPNLSDTTTTKKWDKELSDYREAVRQGVNPAGTTQAKVDSAMRISEATGVAYDADKPLVDISVS